MPKYSDKPCARCGKMMLHAYCSQRYCKACAPLVRSDDAIISRAKQRSKRAISEIARVNALARAERRQDLWLLCSPARAAEGVMPIDL